jgi:hypothetical protein
MTQAHLESLYQEELYKIKPKVLVVIPRPWASLSQDEITLLGKILNAVKLSLSSVQIITRPEFAVTDVEIFQPSHIIAFGSLLKDSAKMYEGHTVSGIPVVVAHELSALDDTRKKNLWTSLKQLFHS